MDDTAGTPAAAPPDVAQQLLDDAKASVQNLFATVVKDELGIVKPVADSYLAAVVAAPDINNIVAQSVSYEGQFIALFPQEQQVAARDSAASIKALLDLEADKLLKLLPGTVASTATSQVVAA